MLTTYVKKDKNCSAEKSAGWVEIQNIDTSEDIRILDKLKTLFDPFRIL